MTWGLLAKPFVVLHGYKQQALGSHSHASVKSSQTHYVQGHIALVGVQRRRRRGADEARLHEIVREVRAGLPDMRPQGATVAHCRAAEGACQHRRACLLQGPVLLVPPAHLQYILISTSYVACY